MTRTAVLALAVALPLAGAVSSGPAAAHHGWAWTTGENVEMTGTVTAVDLGNPHGLVTLEVDGTAWTVEVGQPWRNERAGLAEGALVPGVEMTVSGEPSAEPDEKRLKAERFWIDGVLHDLYPGRD